MASTTIHRGERATRPASFAINEKHIVKAICDLLALHGWTWILTPAEAWLPSGRRVVRSGHSDGAFVRSAFTEIYLQRKGPQRDAEFFFFEAKKPNAKTKEQHAAEQAQWQMEMQARGLLAYRCPDGCGDPIAHFKAWYSEHFGEAL